MYKVKVAYRIRKNGKPGPQVIWAAFRLQTDAFQYADKLAQDNPTWRNVQVVQGR